MSNDSKTELDVIKEKVTAKAKDLKKANLIIQESDEYIALTQAERLGKIEKLTQKRTQIDNDIAQLRLEITEADPDNAEMVEETESRIAKLTKEIKALCHSIPVGDLAKKGLKILDDEKNTSVTITVSKAQTASKYNVDELLEAHPELEEASCEGDFVVVKSVDTDVLDRLVEGGDVDKSVYGFRTIVKTKAPAVRVVVDV